MTLPQLLELCRKSNVNAQKRVYDKYVLPMFLVCRRYMKNDAVAEECLLNGFLKFFQSLKTFTYQSDEAVTAWLRKIMVNVCLQELRKKNSFLLVSESEAIDLPVDENIIDRMSETEIYKLITQLPVGYRTVFNLYVMEGMTHKEIAAALGIQEGTSKSQFSKARQMLQQMLTANNSDYAKRRVK